MLTATTGGSKVEVRGVVVATIHALETVNDATETEELVEAKKNEPQHLTGFASGPPPCY